MSTVRLACALACALWAVPGTAFGQTTVLLGLHSEDGDDDVANELSEALREQVQDLSDWNLGDARPTLFQMTMAHDCDAKTDPCLVKIAEGLKAGQLVVGTLRRSGDQIRVELSLFDAASASRTANASGQIAPSDAGTGKLAVAARAMVKELLGIEDPPPEPEPAAGAAVAAVPENKAKPVAPPARDIEGYDEPMESGGGSLAWLGYTLLGVAAVSTGMAVFSWVKIDSASNDDAFLEYRRAVGSADPTVTDVCGEVDAGERHGVDEATFSQASDQCETGEAFELLQYVFLGTAVVTGGLGLWLVLDDESDSGAARAPGSRLSLTPRVGPQSAGVDARLSF